MPITRRETVGLIIGSAVAAASAGAAFSADDHTVIKVELWDKGAEAGADFDPATPITLATSGAALKDRATMGIALDTYVVKAGQIEFQAVNTSKDFEHEMVVVPWADLSVPLPMATDEDAFDEDAAGAIGEIGETEPGEAGTVVLRLDPGIYVLACNITGHYSMGMWTVLTVT